MTFCRSKPSEVVNLGRADGSTYTVSIGDIIIFVGYSSFPVTTSGLLLITNGEIETAAFPIRVYLYEATSTSISVNISQGMAGVGKLVFS